MKVDPKSGAPVQEEGAAEQTQSTCRATSPKQQTCDTKNSVESWRPSDGVCMSSPTGQSRAPADLSCMFGDVGYYRARYDDFAQRHPGAKPPDYYLEYGEKYARRFTHETYKKLTPEGKQWLENTFQLLQQRMEHLRESDPVAFEKLERDPAAFRHFAFETHSGAYLDGGLNDVHTEDLWHILWAPDLADLGSRDGIEQAVLTGAGLAALKAPAIGGPVAEAFRQVVKAVEEEK